MPDWIDSGEWDITSEEVAVEPIAPTNACYECIAPIPDSETHCEGCKAVAHAD